MKKLLLILLCVPILTLAQKTYVPDDNFEAYLELNGMGDGAFFNDSVLTGNINTITTLYVDNLNIYDLTGIEAFTALTILYCGANHLTSLDVSNSIALTNLHCNNNQLTSLDVSTNTNLTELWCEYNQLTSLDVSTTTNLFELFCTDNQLTSLDLSQNLALTNFACNNNQLTSLVVSITNNLTDYWTTSNPNLFCIDVDNPAIAQALFTNIDPWTSFDTNCVTALGCTDSTACNYDLSATINDGSCFYINCVTNITQNTVDSIIQTSIDSSVNGDTIIVSAGTYYEKINFNGKNIVLASEYLLNNDTSYISLTIIDGTTSGSVVKIKSGEDTTTNLIGFTIQNGRNTTNGGAGIFIENSQPNIRDCIIKDNFTDENWNGSSVGEGGGGIMIISSNVIIDNVSFYNNTSLEYSALGGYGGALGIYYSTLSVRNSIFKDNNASYGSAMWCYQSNLIVENSIYINNGTTQGDIIRMYTAKLEASNITMVEPSTNPSYRLIRAEYNDSINIINSILWSNLGLLVNDSIATISYSNVKNGYIGVGNIDADPMFVDNLVGNYRLTDFSTCIGAGFDTSIVPITDLDGNPRPNPAGSNPDMGAYENDRSNPILFSLDTVEVCDSYLWNNDWYTISGNYDSIFVTAQGYDSIAYLNLQISLSDTIKDTVITCDSYLWNGLVLSQGGIYDTILVNQFSCDSIVSLYLTILNSSNLSTTNYTICDGQNVMVVNNMYTLPGMYYDTLQNMLGCDSILVSVVDVSYLQSTVTSTPVTCVGWNDGEATVGIQNGIPPMSIVWNTNDTTATIGQLGIGVYIVQVSDTACVITDTIQVSINVTPADSMYPEICYITVDSTTGNNKVIIKPMANLLTSKFIIYKESSANIYSPIDTINSNVLEHLDISSNPMAQSYRYKVSVLDTCGNESVKSDFHKTIHLTMSLGVNGEINLLWNAYEGYQPSDYLIFRSVNNGAMNQVSILPGTNLTYTDLTPPSGILNYQVRAISPNCNIIPFAKSATNMLVSNVINHSTTAVNELVNSKKVIKITDLLGRETKGTKNEVIFYIYDDGTVDKRIVIE